jgi:hypothetical protein
MKNDKHYSNTNNPIDFPKSDGMNERIKELAEQAGGGPSIWYTDPDVLEYFAELIISECAFLLKNSTSDKRLNLSPELFKMITNISKAQAEYICEHFGVKECTE